MKAEQEGNSKELESLKAELIDKNNESSNADESHKKALNDIEELGRKLLETNSAAADSEAKLKAEIKSLKQQLQDAEKKAIMEEPSTDVSKDVSDKEQELQTKTTEYNHLLEAYNQYVVAYDQLNSAYAELQQQAAQSQETGQLKQALADKDVEITALKEQVEAKEKELVDKTCTVAKMNITSALAAQMKKKEEVPEQKPVEEPAEEVAWTEE